MGAENYIFTNLSQLHILLKITNAVVFYFRSPLDLREPHDHQVIQVI